MDEPLVSVCLPVWNGARYLKVAIDSVLKQSYPNFELIICDDGSTDVSQDIMHDYAQKDSRIKCFQNNLRLGLFQNYNACMEHAQGEFIKPFAQDDVFHDNLLKELVDILLNNAHVSLASCFKAAVDKDGKEVEFSHNGLPAGLNSGLKIIKACLGTGINLIGEPTTVMFRRNFIGAGFNGSYYSLGDIEYWFRIVRHSQYYCHANKLVSFRSHPGSATSQLLKEMSWVLDFMQLGKEYVQILDDMNLSLEDYYFNCLESVGGLIDQLVTTESLEISNLTGYKEIAFYALRRLGAISKKHRSMHGSISWHITRPLREFSRLLQKCKFALSK